MLMAGRLDMGHARALLAVDAATQVQLGHQVVLKGLSVREAEALVARRQRAPSGPGRTAPPRSRDLERLEEELSDALAATVRLQVDARGRGRVVIQVSGLDQLDGIVARLKG
jgi:ParB family chromosome partitioning protein